MCLTLEEETYARKEGRKEERKEGVSEWVSEWVREWVSEGMSLWVSLWVSDWVCEWMSESVSEWVKEHMNTHWQQTSAHHGRSVVDTDLEEFACSMPDSLHHLLTKAGRGVVLQAAAWGLLAGERAVQEQPCPTRCFYRHLSACGIQEQVNRFLIKALRHKRLHAVSTLMKWSKPESMLTGLERLRAQWCDMRKSFFKL